MTILPGGGRPDFPALRAEADARRRIEKKLARAEARYQHLFEILTQGIVYHDAAGAIREANPAAQRLLGLTFDQMQGRTSCDPRWRAIDESGRDLPGYSHPAMVALRTGLPVKNTLIGVYNPQKEETRWLEICATPDYLEGGERPTGVFAQFEDVTDRRRSEEALRRSEARLAGIIESAVDAIVTVDGRQNIVSLNLSAQRLFGYTLEEIIGQPLTDLLPTCFREGHRARISGFVHSEAASQDVDSLGVLLARRKCGVEFPIDVTISQVTVDGETFCTAILRDVTEREQAARALRENENRLRLALEGGRLGSWEVDIPTSKVVAISDTCRRHCGFPLSEPVTRHDMLNVIHPDDRQRALEVGREAQKDFRDYSVEYRVVWPDGSIRWLIATGTPFRPDASGKPTRIAGITHDITEIRAREAELRRKEESLGAILEGAPLVLWATDSEGRFTLSVGKGLEPLGLKPNALVGYSVLETYRDSPEIAENVTRALRGEAVSFDVRLKEAHFHVEIQPRRSATGEFLGIIGVATDVTERMQSEERFRLLFENSSDAVILFDPQRGTSILDCNRATISLLGCAVREDLIGRRLSAFCPPLQPDGWPSDRMRPQIETDLRERGVSRFEWLHRTPAGNDVPVDVVLTPLVIDGRALNLAVVRDLTERRLAEAALRESEHRLRMALDCGEFGVWDLDIANNRFLSISDRVKTLFGVSPLLDFSWAECQAMMDPDDRREVFARIDWAVRNRTAANVEYRVNRPDGTVAWLHSFGAPILEENGAVTRIVGVTQDTTERKRREQEREAALYEAEERADRDSLTGLLNHRAFHRELNAGRQCATEWQFPLTLALLDLDNFKFFNEVYGYGTGDEVLCLVAERLRAVCHPGDILARFGGDEFALLVADSATSDAEPPTSSQIEARLQARLHGLEYRPCGSEYAIPITFSVGASVCLPAEGSAPDYREAMAAAAERLRRAKTGADVEGEAQRIRDLAGRQAAGFPMLDALVASVDNKDRYTRRHSEDVLTYSVMIAREIGMPEAEIETVAVAALLHDVGKIGVPDAVLRKPGRLTAEEFAAIRQHPEMGAVIVAAVPGLEATLDAVRHHHECWDGTGYPAGLSGQAIPLTARLMAVADAFSAMTTSRPYRRNITREEAIAILKQGAGIQWDPACVEAFLCALERQKD